MQKESYKNMLNDITGKYGKIKSMSHEITQLFIWALRIQAFHIAFTFYLLILIDLV